MTNFRLDNKVAVVTGAGSGIGKAIAEVFATNGAEVVVVERNKEEGEKVAAGIREKGGKAFCLGCDVSNQAEVKKVFDEICSKTSKINILVNNAGISNIGKAEDTSEEDFDKVFSVNVKGVYNCLKYGISKMKSHGGGVILNLASIASYVGLQDRFAYSMSKGAVFTMTLSVAKDYINDHIRCNCICPARVHTPFVDDYLKKNYPDNQQEMFEKLSKSAPIGRMAKPEEVANFALYLCSDEASFLTGCYYPIDGGMSYIR